MKMVCVIQENNNRINSNKTFHIIYLLFNKRALKIYIYKLQDTDGGLTQRIMYLKQQYLVNYV